MAASSVALRAGPGAALFLNQAQEGVLAKDKTFCSLQPRGNLGSGSFNRQRSNSLQLSTVTNPALPEHRLLEHASISRRRQTVCASGGLGSESETSGDGNVKEFFDEEEFRKHLNDAGDKLVVVDISTKTCGPCKMIYPKVVEMSEEFTDAVFLKIQGDHDARTRSLMRDWKVRSVPNFRFYRNGELIHSHTGAKVDKLHEEFQKHYATANA